MRKYLLLTLFIILSVLSSYSQALTWVGTTSTSWSTASNWSPNTVPSASSNVTIPSGAPNMPTVTGAAYANNITINSGATITISVGTPLYVSGNLTNNGTFASSGGTVFFDGSSAQSLTGTGTTTFNNITINGTGGLTLGASITVNNTLTISSSSSSLSAGSNTLTIVGNFTNNGTFTAGTSTVVFNGSSAQTLNGTATFNNLTVSGTGGLTLATGSNPTINGTLSIGSGATLSAGANTITIPGSFTNSGTFTAGTSTVTFNGSSAQTIPAVTFYQLKVSNNSSLGGNVTVNNKLTLSNAIITTGSNTLNIPSVSAISGASSSAYINGNLEMNFASGTLSQTYPIGTSTTYAPVTVAFTSVTTSGGITVSSTDGDEPHIATSPIDATANVKRYWTITNTSGITFGAYSATFTFVAGDLGTGASTSTFKVAAYSAGAWDAPFTPGSLTSTTTQATGITVFGDFQVGNLSSSTVWTGTTSTSWSTASNWNTFAVPSSTSNVIIPSGVSNMPTLSGTGNVNNITINSGATVTLASAATLNVSGNFTNNGTFTDQGGTTIFNGSSAQTLTGTTTFNKVTVSGTGGLSLASGTNITTNGALNISSGSSLSPGSSTITIGGNFTNSGTFTAGSSTTNLTGSFTNSGTFTAGSSTFNISGNYTNNSTFTAGTGTVVFNGSSAQTLNGTTTFNNLTVSSTGGLTLVSGSNPTINGTLNISSGATLSAGANTITIPGSFTNSGTFTAGTGTVVFNGASIQTIPVATFYQLTISHASSLGGNVTVNNKLILNSASITTGSNTLAIALGAIITGASSSAYINGNLEMFFSSNSSQTYPIGTSTTYAPVSISSGTVGSTAGITISTTDGDEPHIATSPIDATANVKRYWTITQSSGALGTYNATFNFVAGDLGTGATTSTFKVAPYSGGAWQAPLTVGTLTSTSTQATGITVFGDFQVGNLNSIPTWTGITSTSWSTASNWNTFTVPSSTTNATIPSGVSNMPTLSGTGNVNNITINSGATLTISSAATLNVSGNFTNNGTYTDQGGTTIFNGSSAQTLTGTTTFNKVTVSGTGGLSLASGTNITTNGALNISSGSSLSPGSSTITIGGNFTNSGTFTAGSSTTNVTGSLTNNGTFTAGSSTTNVTGSFTNGSIFTAGSSTLNISGNYTNNSIFTAGTGTVVFNGSSAQTLNGITTFNNLTASGTGGLTLVSGSNPTINGTLSISSGATLSAGANTITITGSFTNSGTFTAGTSTVTFNGSSAQTIPAVTFYKLKVSNNSSLAGNVTVSVQLTLSNAIITTGSNTLNIPSGSSISGASSSAYINGNLEMNFSSGVLSQVYTIGTSTTYTPVTLTFTSVTTSAGITISGTNGDEPHIATSPIDATANVNRYWTITNTGGITFASYSATFTFVAGDLGTGASTSTFKVAAYSGGTWTEPLTAGTLTSTTTQATGITAFGDFQVGNLTNSFTWVGTTSTNWSTSSNWNTNTVPTSSNSITIPSTASHMPTLSGTGNANNITINSGATLTLSSGATLNASGNLTNNGTYTDLGGTTVFNGSSAQTLTGATTFNNMTVSGTGGLTLASSTNAAVSGTFNISSGSSLSAGSNTLTVGGNFTNSGSFASGTSTVVLNGSSIQTLTGTTTFNNLTVSGTGGLALGLASNLTINGTLNIPSGATLSAGSNTITIPGSFTSSGTFTAGTSTVVFNGSSAQTIPAITFNNLTVSNSSSLAGNVTVNNTLTLSATITTGSNTLNIGGSISGAGSSAYINGNLEMNYSSGTQTQTYPVGTSTTYAPVNLTFNSVISPGGVTVSTTDGDEPNIATSAIDPTANVKRYWTITNTGGITFSTYNATFNFVAGDLGTGANTSNFIIEAYSSGSWTPLTTGTLTSTSSQATGITLFGDFQIGNEGVITMNWVGTTSTNWFTSSNWSLNLVPASTASVTILSSATNMPAITGSATADNITINSGATLTLNSGSTLTVSGNFTNNGTYTDQGGTTVFNGSSAQTLSGATSFNNLTLYGTGGLTLSSATTVSGVSGVGVLSLISGTLTTGGNLTVNLNNAEIAYNSGDAGTVSGNITVNKAVSSIGNHYIGCPLGSVQASQLNSATTVINPVNNETRLFYYTPGAADFTGITDLTTILAPSTGYSLYFVSSTAILTFAGSYTHGANYNSSISCSNSASNSIFFGNPYPSTLDWNAAGGAWNKTNIGNTISYYDSKNSRYATYNGSTGTNGGTQYVPPLQGFFVNTTGSGGTATMGVSSSARVTSQDPAFWRKAALSNTLSITASNDSVSDETIISLAPDATTNFDNTFDAYKYFNPSPVPSVYTVLNNVNYAMNYLPDTIQNFTMPLSFIPGNSGKYSFTAKQVGAFNPSCSIILTDSLLKTTQNLITSPVYSFSANQGDSQSRFSISYRKSGTSLLVADNSPKVAIYSYDKKINLLFKNISADNNAVLNVVDMLGRTVLNINNIDISSGTFSYLSTLPQGIYIAMVNVAGMTYTAKIYIE